MLNPTPFTLPLLIFVSFSSQRNVRGEGCPQSIPTLNEVNACPKGILEWTRAKERKSCYLISQNCTTKEEFEYHCLPNTVIGLFVELCAPPKVIVGYHCPSYDMERNIIEANYNQPCKDHLKPCEAVYKSNSVYKYQECFKENNKEANNAAAQIVIANDYSAFMYVICIFLSACVLLLFIHVCCPGCCQKFCNCDMWKQNADQIRNNAEAIPMAHADDQKS